MVHFFEITFSLNDVTSLPYYTKEKYLRCLISCNMISVEQQQIKEGIFRAITVEKKEKKKKRETFE